MLLVSGKHQCHENEAACTGKLWETYKAVLVNKYIKFLM